MSEVINPFNPEQNHNVLSRALGAVVVGGVYYALAVSNAVSSTVNTIKESFGPHEAINTHIGEPVEPGRNPFED